MNALVRRALILVVILGVLYWIVDAVYLYTSLRAGEINLPGGAGPSLLGTLVTEVPRHVFMGRLMFLAALVGGGFGVRRFAEAEEQLQEVLLLNDQLISAYLDRAVVRCFRAMGGGYQARINRILETWVQMKMAVILVALVVVATACSTGRPESCDLAPSSSAAGSVPVMV